MPNHLSAFKDKITIWFGLATKMILQYIFVPLFHSLRRALADLELTMDIAHEETACDLRTSYQRAQHLKQSVCVCRLRCRDNRLLVTNPTPRCASINEFLKIIAFSAD